MRTLAPSLATAPFLAACALLDGPLALDEIGLTTAEVLASERQDLEAAHSHGRRLEMAEVSAVEDLHCISVPYGRNSPNCRYRLLYRKQAGGGAALKRDHKYFQRDETGHWESVIIVRGD